MTLYFDHREQNRQNDLAERYHRTLLFNKEAESARAYLLKERGLSDEIIKLYKIGYCPEHVKEPKKEHLAGRIIFPIIDEFGDVVSFAGRVFNKEIFDNKYWHLPFSKQYFLYGLNLSWKDILEKNIAVLVEGEVDAIRCYQAGIHNIVGILGTAFTKAHLTKLLMFTDRFIFMFDGNNPGRKCAKSAVDLLKSNRNAKFEYINVLLRFKGVEYDPDDFIKEHGGNKLKRYLNSCWREKYQSEKNLYISDLQCQTT